MLFLYICCFFLTDKPIIEDSTIFKVDILKLEAGRTTLGDNIIDYTIDDYIYALTCRYLLKIDLNSLRTADRIPIPQRFNYVTAGSNEIILIAAGEIITVDKKNFSFLSGIGIEPGDYRPVIAPKLLASVGKGHLVYLISDDGTKSRIKIFDLKTGKLLRQLSTALITSCQYDHSSGTLITSDVNNQVIFRDLNLKKKKQVNLNITCSDFRRNFYGYLIGNKQGIFAVDKEGKIMDFQPMYARTHSDFNNFVFVTDSYLIFLDTLTLRIKSALPNSNGIREVMLLDDLTSIGRNTGQELYLIDNNRLVIEPLVIKDILPEKPLTTPPVLSPDSLWYIQLAAFSRLEYAKTYYDSTLASGLPVFIDSSGLYRIELGGFQDKMTALEILENLNTPGWIILHQAHRLAGVQEFFTGGRKYFLKDGIIRKE